MTDNRRDEQTDVVIIKTNLSIKVLTGDTFCYIGPKTCTQ